MTEQYTYDGSKIYDKEGEYLFQGFMELDGVLIVEKLNEQYKTIKQLTKDATTLIYSNQEYRKENKKLVKMLDNVSNYMQKQHKEMPLDDFVEWWNNIATEGLGGDNGVDGNKIRKRKVKVDGRVDYVGISKEDLG